jgi:hypothetical protein
VTFFGFALLCLLIVGLVLENGWFNLWPARRDDVLYSWRHRTKIGGGGLGEVRCNTQEVYIIGRRNRKIFNLGDISPDPGHGK